MPDLLAGGQAGAQTEGLLAGAFPVTSCSLWHLDGGQGCTGIAVPPESDVLGKCSLPAPSQAGRRPSMKEPL